MSRITRRSRKVRCIGGPWAGEVVRFPVQSLQDPLSLRVHVNGFIGRYNLNTGVWENG